MSHPDLFSYVPPLPGKRRSDEDRMKTTPIHLISSRIRRLSLAHQISHLRGLIVFEKPHSIRRTELESLLREKMTKQLRKENRSAA